MKRTITSSRVAQAVLAALLLSGCGLERIIVEDASGTAREKVKPLSGTAIGGSYAFTANPTIQLVDGNGHAVTGAKATLQSTGFGPKYQVQVPDGDYAGLRVIGTSGSQVLEVIVPELHTGQQAPDANLTVDSTAIALIVQAVASGHQDSLATMRGAALSGIATGVSGLIAAGGATAALRDAVGRVFAAAVAGSTPSLQDPVLDKQFATKTSAVSDAWLAAATVDLDGNGTNDTTTAPFDALLESAAQAVPLCSDPDNLRTLFTVNFNAGQKDGNCATINRFKWVKDEPGKQMFFTGGVHQDSTIQDPVIQAMLGNWIPNIVPMYDDGTHGDEQAGDNIWSISFTLPVGLRTAYKYTWGHQGSGWTGNEEWPGNQRLLEIVDTNSDSLVYRADNFGDEATNKDLVNLYQGGNGKVTWDTDANKDGILDAREQVVNPGGICKEVVETPAWLTPALVYCGD